MCHLFLCVIWVRNGNHILTYESSQISSLDITGSAWKGLLRKVTWDNKSRGFLGPGILGKVISFVSSKSKMLCATLSFSLNTKFTASAPGQDISYSVSLSVVFTLLVMCQKSYKVDAQQCRSEYSIHSMMLKGHIFMAKNTSNWFKCVDKCNHDVRCQSFNYVISQRICELNNRTKEARPEDFVPDSDRFYIKRLDGRGIVLPWEFIHMVRKTYFFLLLVDASAVFLAIKKCSCNIGRAFVSYKNVPKISIRSAEDSEQSPPVFHQELPYSNRKALDEQSYLIFQLLFPSSYRIRSWIASCVVRRD